MFDLLFDDGTVEKGVPRHRLKKAQRLEHYLLSSPPSLLLSSSPSSSHRPVDTSSISGGDSAVSSSSSSGTLGRDSSSSRSSCYAATSQLSTVLAEAAKATASQSGTVVASSLNGMALSVKQRFESRMMARDRRLKKLRRLSGRDAVEDRQAERQAHLDRLDLMKGVKVPSSRRQQQHGEGDRRSISSSSSSSALAAVIAAAAAATGGGGSMSSMSGETLVSSAATAATAVWKEEEEEEGDYEFVSYRDYFSNRDFQGISKSSTANSTTAPSSSSSAPSSSSSSSSSQSSSSTTTKEETAACQLTVQMDARWQLVYVGNENSYACSHLVPSDVLSRELDISVPVQLCVQVLGADHPMYERSQPSVPVTFFTKSPRSMQADGAAAVRRLGDGADGAAAVRTSAADGAAAAAVTTGRPSKLKREILSAAVMIRDQHHQQQMTDRCVQIEKPSPHECCSRGIGDSYL